MISDQTGTNVAVIGTGLSAMACTAALVERGLKPTILDSGIEPPNDVNRLIARMKWVPPNEWAPTDLLEAKQNKTVRTQAIPKKLFFGSDYVFSAGMRMQPTSAENCDVAYTRARSGFSSVWGAAMLPVSNLDMDDWPLCPHHLSKYYKKILSIIPLSAERDHLEREFPLYKSNIRPVDLGPQLRKLLDGFGCRSEKLGTRGIIAGRPRLAVYADPNHHTPGCDSCGLCLTGCPREAIFSTKEFFTDLIKREKIRYLNNRFVLNVEEIENKVLIKWRPSNEASINTVMFDRVFVACGALNSTRLIMHSLKYFQKTTKIRESQKFIVPFLTPMGNSAILDSPSFALASALMMTKYGAEKKHWSQMQLSVASDLVFQSLGIDLERMPKWRKFVISQFLGRVLIGWGSLNSSHSSHMELSMPSPGSSLHVKGVENPLFREAANGILRNLLAAVRETRLMPFSSFVRFAPAGHGNHLGASIPMANNRSEIMQSDMLGCPTGFQRTHVVDAAVLPSIPGTTVSLPAMANAWRIADLATL